LKRTLRKKKKKKLVLQAWDLVSTLEAEGTRFDEVSRAGKMVGRERGGSMVIKRSLTRIPGYRESRALRSPIRWRPVMKGQLPFRRI